MPRVFGSLQGQREVLKPWGGVRLSSDSEPGRARQCACAGRLVFVGLRSHRHKWQPSHGLVLVLCCGSARACVLVCVCSFVAAFCIGVVVPEIRATHDGKKACFSCVGDHSHFLAPVFFVRESAREIVPCGNAPTAKLSSNSSMRELAYMGKRRRGATIRLRYIPIE